ncbi:hypothetical protein SAMN05216223_1414 [Actinacidiphila yanglinensis]|uniref:Transcriptional regulator n=1 Tax=Actinacidiphila yanglinensis TaxID=310779 RepID=A0A1H6EHC9_9ACTN|nr:transcriptional regulator [Actinacidiphila yanglinensis]SEG96204.1 hypothetical protein SAMN05216223_1414 [Actinacidiphila yanglinensis]
MAARRIVTRPPNERLQALISEAGCSNIGLARRVNQDGAQRGLDLRYDKTSVSRWLRGQQPRGATPSIIARVLSRKLGREVSVEEVGMARNREPNASEIGLAFAATLEEAIDQATGLWRGDATRRNLHTGSRLAISTLLAPSRDWLIAVPDREVAHIGDQPVTSDDAELVARVTPYIADLDHFYGSEHVRPLAVHYLDTVVSRMLKGSYGGDVGPQLSAAAARLTKLTGSMAADSRKPALAQRYYIQALRLSQAADDRRYGAYVLAAGMSHLAAELGYPQEVTQLARTAQEGARRNITPALEACLYAAEARGYALLGDRQSCSLAAGRALQAMDRSVPDREPDWIAHFDRARLAGELAHCYVDLRHPGLAVRHAEEAIIGTPEHRVRRRAINLLLLATAQIQAGEVDEACDTATEAVGVLARVRSGLGVEYLKRVRYQLRAFAERSAVRDFEELLREGTARRNADSLTVQGG